MPKKPTETPTAHPSAETGSTSTSVRPQLPTAPMLPAAVAKQYGLHDHSAQQVDSDERSQQVHQLINDAATEAAVDDIAAADGDALLAAEDAANAPPPPTKRGFWRSIGHFFVLWWQIKWARYMTLIIILVALGAAFAVPKTRYMALNAVGVRSTASVVVLDNTSKLPLKNVTVRVGEATAKTNVDGVAAFEDLKLGPTTLRIKRVAFAPYDLGVTIGWGSNPLGEYKLVATGVQYTLLVTDYLSGKPIANVEAVSDEANALSDRAGKILLTVEDSEATTLPVTLQKAGYRNESLVLDAESEATARTALVPAQKHVFVSKDSGKYDVLGTYLDGKDRVVLLPGTGNETSNISLVASPDGSKVAVVSTRDGTRDKDGYALSALTLVDTTDGASTIIDHGAQIQLITWMDGRLVYRVGVPGASAANAQRYRIIAYNTETMSKLQLTSANQFTMTGALREYIYYAASSNDPKATAGLFKIKPDGTGKKKVASGEIWTAFRNGYDTLRLQAPEAWYEFTIGSEAVGKVEAPTSFESRAYLADTKNQWALWIDTSKDKESLRLYAIASNKDKTLVTQEGIVAPMRWIDDKAIVYRVATKNETADYAISPQGGQPRKITDVTASYGIITE